MFSNYYLSLSLSTALELSDVFMHLYTVQQIMQQQPKQQSHKN